MPIDLNTLKEPPQKAPRILIHGGEGVGKTTFACGAPNVYLLDLEKGRVNNKPMMPQEPDSYDEVLEHIIALIEQDHKYKTLVIDTLDVLESMITDKVCNKRGWECISDPGFGKGYDARTAIWYDFWKALECLRETKNMIIIMIAHSQVVSVKDPILPTFDSQELHLYKTEKAKATEWPDIVGFCMIKAYTTKDGARNLATTAGKRVILTSKNPAYTAKNRYGMPEEIPLSWGEFEKHFKTN
jgi:hypothetical protein